jgi:hypothetical protein
MQFMNKFNRLWVFRTWVVQEIVMAQVAVVVSSGEPLQFDYIANFAQMITSE